MSKAIARNELAAMGVTVVSVVNAWGGLDHIFAGADCNVATWDADFDGRMVQLPRGLAALIESFILAEQVMPRIVTVTITLNSKAPRVFTPNGVTDLIELIGEGSVEGSIDIDDTAYIANHPAPAACEVAAEIADDTGWTFEKVCEAGRG